MLIKKLIIRHARYIILSMLFVLHITDSAYAESEKYFVVLKQHSDSAISTHSLNKNNTLARNSATETRSDIADRLINEVNALNSPAPLFKANTAVSSVRVRQDENKIVRVYQKAINGFSAMLSSSAAEHLKTHPDVRYVAKDAGGEGAAIQSPTVNWGIDRIDQANLPLNGNYEYSLDGTGVHAYIFDSGILATHQEFVGRIGNGIDFIDNDSDPADCNGHGTHVAGILGGSTYGVAKNVTIHPIRVLNCNNKFDSTSNLIDAIEWVLNNLQLPAVANMSLGTFYPITPIDDAVNSLIDAGVTTVVAAMNDSRNGCGQVSPGGRVPNAITVAASTIDDAQAFFSNFGPCIDLYAPGLDIKSAWNTSDTAILNAYGTSMSSPHVAGVVTKLLEETPTATPAQITQTLLGMTRNNAISNPGPGTPNKLLNHIESSAPSTQYYFIINKASGLKMHSCSNIDGTTIAGESSALIGYCAQWEKVVNGSYFHLKNRYTGKFIRPNTSVDGSHVVIRPNTWTGHWTQWSEITLGGGYVHLVNRQTGKFIRPLNGLEGTIIELRPNTWTGHWTHWAFQSAN